MNNDINNDINNEKITEVKTTDSVTITRDEFEKLMFRAVDATVLKDDPNQFLLTSLIAVKTISVLQILIFGEEDN